MARRALSKRISVALLIATISTIPGFSVYANVNPKSESANLIQKQAQTETQSIFNNWYQNLVGRKANPDETALINAINANDNLVSTEDKKGCWDSMVKDSPAFLWSNLPLGNNSANITASYKNVYNMALAYRLPNSKFYNNQNLKNDILFAMNFLNEKVYNNKIKKIYGNWWDFEIGTPLTLVNILTLMKTDLDKDSLDKNLASIDNFVPDPIKRKSLNKPSFKETGANLIDKCFAVTMRGVLGNDENKIKLGIQYIDSAFIMNTNYGDITKKGTADGFYIDGSFIQHDNLAYAAGYGAVFLERVSDFLTALKDTSYLSGFKNIDNVYRFVSDSFVPLFYKGAIMDNTRGRGVSRLNSNDHLAGRAILVYINKIAKTNKSPEYRRTYQGFVKSMILSDTSFTDYMNGLSLPRIQSLTELLNDSTIPNNLDNRNEFKAMNFMKRYVSQKGSYAAGLSLFSNKMSSFEYGNKENRKGFYQGAGVLNLYNDDTTQYSGNYYPTIDMARLPGITTDGSYGKLEEWKSYLNPKEYSGGATDGIYGAIGFEFSNINLTGSDLSGRKSWFFFDNEIVALGSDINSTSNSPVETVIENRKLKADGSNKLIVQGNLVNDKLNSNNSTWAYLEGKTENTGIGYYIPEGQNTFAQKSLREGTWFDINNSITTPEGKNKVSEYYGYLSINHGTNPKNSSYSYVILPNRNLKEIENYANTANIKILKNSITTHAVEDSKKNILCINFFEADTYEDFTASNPLSLLVKGNNNGNEYYLSDPTMKQESIELKVKVKNINDYDVEENTEVSIDRDRNIITFRVNTSDKDGTTHKLVLNKK
ncbi:hyaluronate lyase [Clostridium cavendishii DSM 21758]|uniref:Hyaluronate lyase n=1 Tax=Clostridium cavendishii DSM 21758 TaxID=1121302 RepID=A0A1M6F7E1_9CLOT|nr:polysaccharide lyase 8 family protein [Clostridium cavendishii]SHI93664.1 hyaluronate lyase [Clostridium cavendishii DSM 21758]